MVPRTSHRVANHQSLGEGAAVMRAGCADREDFITAAREQHGVLANGPADHAAIGKIIEWDAAREIGSFRFGLLGGHNVLPIAGSTGSFGWRRTRRRAPIGVSRQSCVPRINCRCSYGSQYRQWPAVGVLGFESTQLLRVTRREKGEGRGLHRALRSSDL